MRSEDIAFARLAAIGPSPAEKARLDEINRGIDATMREVIAAPKYNPYELDKRPDGSHRPPEVVTPVGAVKLAEDLPVPLLPGAPTPGAVPWDWIRLGEPKPKEEEEK